MCVQLSGILSDEAMDHVKKMCGPGYTIENGKPVPIEPEVMKIPTRPAGRLLD